ncbi:MAG: hypothetical protein HUU20_20850 [Pirellulales bacterium]|nr:hypothetical protein [Pirellulales bacterium]
MKGHSADVKSLDAVDQFAHALREFHDSASVALDELAMEIHRAVEWIQHDCKNYWNEQVRRGYQQVSEARVALERKQMFRVADHRPGCYDEKKALELAKRRLALAQEKVETVRRWSWEISQAVLEYRGDVGPLAQWLEADLPRAVALMERLRNALDHYVGIDTVEAELPAGTAAGDEAIPSSAGALASPSEPASEKSSHTPSRNPQHEDLQPDDRRGPTRVGSGDASEGQTRDGRTLE